MKNKENTSSTIAVKNPLVSVVIPVYNGEQFIRECLNSVYAQEYHPIEVIIVNDGSTDRSLEILKKYDGEKIIITQEHKNLPTARNTGIKHAKGEFVAFLDIDDFWHPHKLRAQMSIFKQFPDTHMVFSDVIKVYSSGAQRYQKDKARLCRQLVKKDPFPLLARKNLIVPSSVIVKKSVFASVGLFDETLNSCEDWEFWLRLALYHYQIKYVADVLVYYRYHEKNMSKSARLMHEGRLQVMHKIFSKPDLPVKYEKYKAESIARIYYHAANSYYRIGEVDKFLEYCKIGWTMNKRVIPVSVIRRLIRETFLKRKSIDKK